MLKINNLSKKFNNVYAVQNLNLTLSNGEIYALIGPNGAGKTTTLKMIMGLLAPTSGEVWIDNYSIFQHPVQVKAMLGYIPDEPFMFGKLTGREILRFVAKLYNLKLSEIESSIQNLLAIYKLEGIADALFDDYSRGNKQKLSILTALLHQPKLFIFDEPIVGLDPESIFVTKDLMLNIKKQGSSILISTHTLSFAEQIADRVGFIQNGVIVKDDYLKNLKLEHDSNNLEDIYLRLSKASK